ncbi:MAG: hypothetical protein ACRDTG_15010 [Pseudonocardiaceae bacterium]
MLSQFLAFVTRLQTAANAPTFAPVLRTLKRDVTGNGWRYALLQLEVSRALRGTGTTITFEPEIAVLLGTIPASALKMVFASFQRTSSSTATALAHTLADDHGITQALLDAPDQV